MYVFRTFFEDKTALFQPEDTTFHELNLSEEVGLNIDKFTFIVKKEIVKHAFEYNRII